VLSAGQREQRESMASWRSLPAGRVSRVRIILMSASGRTNPQIARQLGLAKATVITRCRRHHRHQEYLDFLRQTEKNVRRS